VEESEKITMYCPNCDSKQEVLEGEVTCPKCGTLLEPAPEQETEEPDQKEAVLGLEIQEDDGDLDEEE